MSMRNDMPYEIFHDDEDGRTVVIIRDLDVNFEKAKVIANTYFKVNKKYLVAGKAIVNNNIACYDDVSPKEANAIAVWLERR